MRENRVVCGQAIRTSYFSLTTAVSNKGAVACPPSPEVYNPTRGDEGTYVDVLHGGREEAYYIFAVSLCMSEKVNEKTFGEEIGNMDHRL